MLIFILLSTLSIFKMKTIERPEVNKANMGQWGRLVLAYFKVKLSHYSPGECPAGIKDGSSVSPSVSWEMDKFNPDLSLGC